MRVQLLFAVGLFLTTIGQGSVVASSPTGQDDCTPIIDGHDHVCTKDGQVCITRGEATVCSANFCLDFDIARHDFAVTSGFGNYDFRPTVDVSWYGFGVGNDLKRGEAGLGYYQVGLGPSALEFCQSDASGYVVNG